MYFKQLSISGFDHNFSYAFGDEQSREVFLIDPDNYDYLIDFLNKENLKLKGIILTHGHFDHVGVAPQLAQEFEVPVYLHKDDWFLLKDVGIRDFEPLLIDLSSKSELTIGNLKIKIIKTPGHTPGSICLLIDDVLLTGDTLFVDGCGRTDFFYSDEDEMKKSLKKIKSLPEEINIYSGHDYGSRPLMTLRDLKKNNWCLKDL